MLVPSFSDAKFDFFSGGVLASDPSVIKQGDQYRLVYTDYDGTHGHTIIASVATDGTAWHGITPVVTHETGLADNFESAEIVAVGQRTFVYASGYADDTTLRGFPAALYGFEVTNGTTVALSGRPLLAPTPGWYDSDAIYSPTVVAANGGYVMYYVGHAYFDTHLIEQPGVYLLAATSPDGIHWTKEATPVLSPGDGPAWARDGIAEPDLLVGPDGTVHLFFTGLDGENRVIGHATAPSLSGPFTFAPEPIVTPGMVGPQVAQVLAPTASLDGGALSLWFLAYGTDGTFRIAHGEVPVTLPAPGAPPASEPASAGSGGSGGSATVQPLEGTAGDDLLLGGNAADSLLGLDGRDTLAGGGGNDTLDGGRLSDVLSGEAGSDRLFGRGGHDTLLGGDGADVLSGGGGRDILLGGGGNDVLDGGGGADVFVFEGVFGKDSIASFELGLDCLALDLSADRLAGMVASEAGGNLVLTFGADSITIAGLALADLEHLFA